MGVCLSDRLRGMSDNSPQRQLAPDDSPPVSGQFAPSLWTIRPKSLDDSPPSCEENGTVDVKYLRNRKQRDEKKENNLLTLIIKV